ncbi:Aste57867_2075 [Aphanomyces stellatus]|uniref:Aste57867_2075 protein n=1 Tax=Aphanomyces stellatus TaxID=120398 RepID=A0A485K857_9STRA|nr:hypothetical protein As57867_002071 [Aphanomyces stellatus]VFT79278.1 Aste57867_2075 [Aphanomyces stellatus]
MGHCYLKYLKGDPLRGPMPSSRGAITYRSRASILRGLGYVRVQIRILRHGGCQPRGHVGQSVRVHGDQGVQAHRQLLWQDLLARWHPMGLVSPRDLIGGRSFACIGIQGKCWFMMCFFFD